MSDKITKARLKNNPPDMNQCQAIKMTPIIGNPFQKPEPKQCENKPQYFLSTKEPDEKGVHHTVSVCDDCSKEVNLDDFISSLVITEESSAST